MTTGSVTRTFVALSLPDPVARELGRWIDRLRARLPSIRWVDPARIHLTLAFLGDVPDRALPEVAAAVSAAARRAPAMTLEVSGLGAFPDPRRARVVWAGVGGPGREALARLQADLAATLADVGFPGPAREPFTPHLTLGRARAPRGVDLTTARAAAADFRATQFDVTEIFTCASELRPEGPRYTRLARDPLDATNDPGGDLTSDGRAG
jgi:2'-5' RNA ligase